VAFTPPLSTERKFGRWAGPLHTFIVLRLATAALSCRGALVLLSQGASGRILQLASGARGSFASRRWAPGFVRRPAGIIARRAPHAHFVGPRWLVFENSFSPAVGSPRRQIKKSLTPTEKSYTERARLYGNPARFEKALSKITRRSTPIPPAPGTSARAKRARETQVGGLSRHARASASTSALMTPASLRV